VGIFDKVGRFFEELDAFVDDATARRLGNGAAFYGKRKSNFYGKEDKGRKRDRTVPDPTGKTERKRSNGEVFFRTLKIFSSYRSLYCTCFFLDSISVSFQRIIEDQHPVDFSSGCQMRLVSFVL
jgi:hypothetical protein